ncbi:uncharacterized protein LOC116806507 [Drosophila grimshawi]|uniref:uncharacterized protein LOC116806507 n=1 Tax=Drosophila grimshawi TaxID=7222 RepID=UPI0013EEFEA0|nr:uncharacterized protein LOC116806507 [Drosophila grimshawi]
MWIKIQLWYLVQEAQFIYKHLTSLLRKRLVLKCSWPVYILAVVQILLIIFLSWKLFRKWAQIDFAEFNYITSHIIGVVHLIFALHLSLHVFYHLLHTALLQSLNLLVQQLHIPKDLKLLRQLLYVQPSLKRMQHVAAYYFSATFCWFYFLLCLRGGVLVNNFRYDDTTLNQNKKSLNDIEDEADWVNIEAPPTRDQQLRTAALDLMWPVCMLFPLICAAYVQQREYKKLMNGIWKIDFPRTKKAVKKDIVSFLLSTRMSMVDFRPRSINFMAWKPKSDVDVVQIAGIVTGYKMILHVVLCTTIVDFMKQMDLRRYENYLKQNLD